MDSLTKTASVPQHGAPVPGPTDASKVLAKGLGLSKAYVGQKSSFTVDCSKAGGCLDHRGGGLRDWECLWGYGCHLQSYLPSGPPCPLSPLPLREVP